MTSNRRGSRRALTAAVCGAALTLLPTRATARRFRARFEPDTVELAQPGKLRLDAQLGGVWGDGEDGTRLIAPDFELDLGLLSWLDLAVEGGFTLIQVGDQERRYIGEPLWTAVAFEIVSIEDKRTGNTFGVGLQGGPRLPTYGTASGVGGALLGLVGAGTRHTQVVGNLGATFDRELAIGLTYGVEVQQKLREKWLLVGQLAGLHTFGPDPKQLFFTVGLGRELSEQLQLEAMAITGPVYRGDRLGFLLGVRSELGLW